jgi:hypothetical protein
MRQHPRRPTEIARYAISVPARPVRPWRGMEQDGSPSELRYRRIALFWIVVAVVVALGLVVLCVLAVDWLVDYASGSDAAFVAI